MLQNKFLEDQNSSLRYQLSQVVNQLSFFKHSESLHRDRLIKLHHYLSFYRTLHSSYSNLLTLLPKDTLKDISKPGISKNSTRLLIPEELCEPEALDRKIKQLVKKDKEAINSNLNRRNQLEIDEFLKNQTNFISSKQKYIEYLKSLAKKLPSLLEERKSVSFDNKRRIYHAKELLSFEKAHKKAPFFPNNSDITDYWPMNTVEILELMDLHHDLRARNPNFKDISAISEDSNEAFNLNVSFLDENLNDVSQQGEVLIMNRFHNPFQNNYKGEKLCVQNHNKVPGRLYSPLSKINPDVKENSFEQGDGRKGNISFMSNGDEIFF